MLTDNPLPDDLAAIERQLQSDACEPTPALRDQVMARVQSELDTSPQPGFWRFAAAVAAVVVLLINQSVSVARVSIAPPPIDPDRVAHIYGQLTDLQLGLSPQELRRQCVLMAAGELLTPLAKPYGSLAGAAVDTER